MDRGPKPREVMDLMMVLEKEAKQAGGQVVGLLGNHEMMNIMGDLRYVTPDELRQFRRQQFRAAAEIRISAVHEMAQWSSPAFSRASPAHGNNRSGVDGTASPRLR